MIEDVDLVSADNIAAAMYQVVPIGPFENLAVLKAKIEIKDIIIPPDPVRNRPKTIDFLRKVTVRTLPQNPPGEGGPR